MPLRAMKGPNSIMPRWCPQAAMTDHALRPAAVTVDIKPVSSAAGDCCSAGTFPQHQKVRRWQAVLALDEEWLPRYGVV
jgi:hypothetical protein